MNWWQYLLLVNLYLVLFYCFYALLLRRETFFQLNRVYLVSSAVLSFFIPLIQARWVQDLFITQKVEYTIYSDTIAIHSFKPVQEAPVNLGELLAYLYLAGIAFLVIKLIGQLIHLNKIIKLPEQGAAYSFFKKIKLDMEANANDAIAAHEQVHAKQWHSADVMIMEAVMIINWFNPVVYFYRRAIKHIHEFIADSRAVKSAPNKSDYALLLLSHTFNAPQHHLVNHFFNGSLLKQRIIMLQKNKSHRVAMLKYGLSAPLFILMLVLSSATVNNSRAIKKVDLAAQTVFNQPVNTSIILRLPDVIQKCDTTLKPKPLLLTAHTDTNKIRIADVKIDSTVKHGTDSVRSHALLSQLPGVKINENGTITAQGQQVTKVHVNGVDMTPDNIVFSSVEIQPKNMGFYDYLQKNLRYPADARFQKIQGKAIVTFIVEKDGSVTNVRLLKSPNESLGAEAVRVVSMSPNWTPGYQNGKVVRSQFTVPISFSLTDGKTSGLTFTAPMTDTTKTITNIKLLPPVPLYILDGKELNADDFKFVDIRSIERIDILKDKQAKLIYGEKGANGVVVITTKKHLSLEKDKRPGFN
jgi:TonB family protein